MLRGDSEVIRSLITKRISGKREPGLEIEVRFTGLITDAQFERLLRFLSSLTKEISTSQSEVAIAESIRRIITYGDKEKIEWQIKKELEKRKLKNFDLRLAINTENPIASPKVFEPTIIRHRYRRTFILPKGFQVDMTEVTETTIEKKVQRYEVEIEFKKGTTKDIAAYIENIVSMYIVLKGTTHLYTSTMRNELDNEIIKVLGFKKIKEALVEARNIKVNDLVYGGIVGNQAIADPELLASINPRNRQGTDYMMTYKVDGDRKMLIIHSTGIWLIYPPFEYNLVIPRAKPMEEFLDTYSLTILDGEYAPLRENKRKRVFFYFDCLCFKNSAEIQANPYNRRIAKIKEIFEVFRSDDFSVEFKVYDEILDPAHFFELITKYLRGRKSQKFKEDGIIFTPMDSVYNPHLRGVKYSDRILTNYPDVCKWKEPKDLTIDFWVNPIIEDDQRVLELLVFDQYTKQNVPFTGTKTYPFNLTMVNHEHLMTLKIKAGTIVEYEWNYQLKVFQPRKIRYHKGNANKVKVAKNIWFDINNPITSDDLMGQTILFSRTFLNRLKTQLYQELSDQYAPHGFNILDIGSGKGGDLNRWKLLQGDDPDKGHIIAVEPNKKNRTQFRERLTKSDLQDKVLVIPQDPEEKEGVTPTEPPEIGGEKTVEITEAVRSYLSEGKVEIEAEPARVEAVTMMLSMSFFFSSKNHLEALVQTIVTNLQPGGSIIFVTIDGDTVEQIFEPALGGPILTDLEIVTAKLHLYPRAKLDFVENKISEFHLGRALDFFLPDETIVGEQKEYLVHLDALTLRLEAYGIYLEYLHRAEGEKLMTPENALYSSMFSYGRYINRDPGLLAQYQADNPIPFNIAIPNSMSLGVLEEVGTIKQETFTVASNQEKEEPLPWLAVDYKRHPKTHDDDTHAPLTCSWYSGLFRIATIGEGSCLIHAILKAFYPAYQENSSIAFRLSLVEKVRRDLAVLLGYANPLYPEYTYWETLSHGYFPRMLMLELQNEALVAEMEIDYSFRGLQRLLNSHQPLGDEMFSFISELFNLDLYILRATVVDLYIHLTTHLIGRDRDAIVIIGNGYHYETVAIETSSGLRTRFPSSHSLIESLNEKFESDLVGKALLTPYDPDATFIRDYLNIFLVDGELTAPPQLRDRLAEDDPFMIMFDRLWPEIQVQGRGREESSESEEIKSEEVAELLGLLLTLLDKYDPSEIREVELAILEYDGYGLSLDEILDNLGNHENLNKNIVKALLMRV